MKITNERSIKTNEKDLVDAIIKDIDWHAVERIIKEKYQIGIEEDVRYRHGDIVVHNDQVAYRVNFDVTVPFSILIDRAGASVSVDAFQGGKENRAVADGPIKEEDPFKDGILEELTREMDTLDEESPIELSNIVGNRSASAGSGPHMEASFIDSAVTG